MRKLLSGLIALALTLSSFGATQTTGAPTYNVSLEAVGLVYDKAFMQFDLPAVSGTITAVTLHINCSTYSGTTFTTYAYVSEDTTWNESTAVATLDAITYLGASTSGTTNGVKQAYADSKTTVTIVLEGPAVSATLSTANLKLGDHDIGGPVDGVSFTDRSGSPVPYLEIVYTPSGRPGKPIKAAVRGITF